MATGDKRASTANTFATASDAYARSRPRYPPALFDWIADTCRAHESAWDCATGNGQAALAIAQFFVRVEATDISSEQVAHGFPAANIRYSTQPAESTDFPDAGFDLVTVAQALHWFDPDRFWPELRRVARPGSLFCAWGYAWFSGSREVHDLLLDPVARAVEPFWADNNRTLWRGYRPQEVRFPFEPLVTPALSIEVDWSTDELIGYVRTWSAFKTAVAAGRAEALENIVENAATRLGRMSLHRLSVPLAILAGWVD